MTAIIQFALTILVIISLWKIFVMFGEKGWTSLIPFYNIIVWLRIVKWDPVKFWFFFIPLYNVYLMFCLYRDLAAKFGKGTGFACGILFLPFIFLPMLAFKEQPIRG